MTCTYYWSNGSTLIPNGSRLKRVKRVAVRLFEAKDRFCVRPGTNSATPEKRDGLSQGIASAPIEANEKSTSLDQVLVLLEAGDNSEESNRKVFNTSNWSGKPVGRNPMLPAMLVLRFWPLLEANNRRGPQLTLALADCCSNL